jgi:hypothetical protein
MLDDGLYADGALDGSLYSDGILEVGLYTDGLLEPFNSDLMVLRGRSSSSYSGSAESGASGRLDCPGIFEAGRSDAAGRAEDTGRIEEAAGTLEVKDGRKLLRDGKCKPSKQDFFGL